MRTEDKAGVKEYLRLMDEQGLDVRKFAAVCVFREIDRARHYLDMVFEEPDCIRDRTRKLKDGMGKSYAILVLTAAQEKLDEAQEWADRVDALIEKGAGDSVARFRRGTASALEHPFPLIASEEELKTIMNCLAGAFTAVDIGIGRIEETEGMACRDGHYWNLADGALWEGGAGDQAWLSVLWPMRSLEKMIISAQDAVHDAACRVDSLRPKAHSIIKKHVLAPGLQWEQEKERGRAEVLLSGNVPCKTAYAWGGERMEEQEDSLCVAEKITLPKAKEDSGRKPSLRKRLKMAEEKSHKMHEMGRQQEQKSKVGERQR